MINPILLPSVIFKHYGLLFLFLKRLFLDYIFLICFYHFQSPYNVVRYEISNIGNAVDYFTINEIDGTVSVRQSLINLIGSDTYAVSTVIHFH